MLTIIRGTVDIDGVAFTYGETRSGGSRGIEITTQGAGKKQYFFKPDPHRDPAYNKNNAKFYRQVAEVIGEYYAVAQGWPPYDTEIDIAVSAVTYLLVER